MDRGWTVPASAGVLALENVALIGGLLFAGQAPLFVLVLLLCKFPLCAALLRLQLAAVWILILWESLTLGVALMNTSLTPPGQVALFLSALTGSTLLAVSLPLYAPVRTELTD